MPTMEAVDIDKLSLRRADKRYSEACKRVAEMSGATTDEKRAVLREAAKGHPFQLHYSLHGQLVRLNP